MSRRSDLIQQLISSKKFGPEKKQEQEFLMATAELIQAQEQLQLLF